MCPSSSTCGTTEAGGLGCYCEPGFEAFLCDGTRCNQPGGGNFCDDHTIYFCRSAEVITETCTSEPHASAGNCVCADSRMPPFVCGETDSCEQRCATGCNLAASDCPEQTKKCNVGFDVPGDTLPSSIVRDRPVCTELLGNRQRGETCKRVPLPDGGRVWFRDDCGIGLTCDTSGEARGDARCHKLCTTLTGCAAGETCEFAALTFSPIGTCVKSMPCTIGGTECGAGRSCAPSETIEREHFSYCKYDGREDAGARCSNTPEDAGGGCGPNLLCRGGTCKPACSLQRPWVTGQCNSVGWENNDPGFCE